MSKISATLWEAKAAQAAKDATDFAGFGGCLKTQSLEIADLTLGSAIQLKQSHDISWTGN